MIIYPALVGFIPGMHMKVNVITTVTEQKKEPHDHLS